MSEEGRSRLGEPFWHLYYRYFWPFPYFRDVSAGSLLERQQNYRHNRTMRIHLPGFIVKWLVLAGLSYALGGFFEEALSLAIPAAGCFLSATWALVVVAVLAACWMWLERFPELG